MISLPDPWYFDLVRFLFPLVMAAGAWHVAGKWMDSPVFVWPAAWMAYMTAAILFGTPLIFVLISLVVTAVLVVRAALDLSEKPRT